MDQPQKHWAARYIGLPWVLDAQGPDAYDCWALVRAVQRDHFGRTLAPLDAGIEAVTAGWRLLLSLDSGGTEGDIVEMRSARGPHVGVLVFADGRWGVLHAVGFRDGDGVDHGDVTFTPFPDLIAFGLGRVRIWTPQ